MSLNFDKSNWPRVRLGDVVERAREQWDQSEESIDRYVAGGHFDDGAAQVTRFGSPEDGGMGSTFTYVFEPGDVLYVSASWYLRKVGVATFRGVVADKTYVMRSGDEGILDQRFLVWILLSDALHAFAASESTGSMNARLLWGTLARFEFALPPLPEQRRIADLLWAAEHHRRSERAALDLLVKAERSMLGGWLSSPGEGRAIETLIRDSIGGLYGEEAGVSPINVRMIRGTDIDEFGTPRLPTAPMRSFTERELASRLLSVGDIVLEKSGGSPTQPVGKVGLVVEDIEPSICSNFCLRIAPNTEVVESGYLFLLLRGLWLTGGFAPVTGKTTNIANLRTSELFRFEVSVPTKAVQSARVADWRAMTRFREIQAEGLLSVSRLTGSLLSEAFG